jgi:hypothetical protein
MISLNSYHNQRIALVILIISLFVSIYYFNFLLIALMGCALWVIINPLIFAPALYEQLAQGVTPLLQVLLQDHPDSNIIKKNLIEKISGYPEWVFRIGFNPGLRAGYRFFLIQLEHVCELYFSMDYYINHRLPDELLIAIKEPLETVRKNNQKLILVIIEKFKNKNILNTGENYINDLVILTDAVKRLIPHDLSLLDVSPDSVSLAAFLQDLTDLRHVLLQLVAAMPESGKH